MFYGRKCLAAILCTTALQLASGVIPVVPSEPEYRIFGTQSKDLEFTLEKPVEKGHFIILEFRACLRDVGFSGYDYAMQVWCNGTPVANSSLLNVPEMFRRNNGAVSMASSWVTQPNSKGRDEKIDQFCLMYGPSYRLIASDQCPYQPQEWDGVTFRFNLTPYIRQGINRLKLCNMQMPNVHKILKRKDPIPAVVSNLKLYVNSELPKKQEDWWLKELKAMNKTPRLVEPRSDSTECYDLDIRKDGRIFLKSGTGIYALDSYYSYPHGGFNCFGKRDVEAPEKGWTVSSASADGAITMHGSGSSFNKVERTLQRYGNYISVCDTITNLTARKLPVIVKYHLSAVQGRNQEAIRVSGMPVKRSCSSAEPENPTVFLPAGKGGCGMVPVSDIFQIHSIAFANHDICGLTDQSLVLQPFSSVSVKFEIYPISNGDMFSFVNNARDHWKLNAIRADFGKRALINFKEEIPGRIQSWTPYQQQIRHIWIGHFAGWSDTKPRRALWKWGPAVLSDKKMCSERKELVAALREQYPHAREVPIYYCLMAPYGSNDPKRLDDELYKDWIIVDKSGIKLSEAGYHYFIPTHDNEFGRMIRKLVDTALDDWKCDGILFDYLEGSKPYFTYNRTDGVSGDIDPVSKTLIQEKASYQLLSNDFIIDLIRHIVIERGKKVFANRSFYTHSTMSALKDLIPVRFGEAISFSQLTRSYFAPVPNALQRTYRDVNKQFIGALYMGTVPHEYDFPYESVDSPETAIWPIAIKEIHQGYIIGTDKIITAVSGDFSFGDMDEVKVKLYDDRGRPANADFKTEIRNGKRITCVRLDIGQIVVLNKVHHSAK